MTNLINFLAEDVSNPTLVTPITSIDQQIAKFFNELWNYNGWAWGNLLLIVFSLIMTVVLSSFIGLEREVRGRSAGLRTHLLVAVGSAIIMIISIYGFPNVNVARDPARLAAQVVTGVGFLGAGAIIHYAGGIKGLTTASTIWLSMAIGLACGSMNFVLATISTLIVMVVLITFRKLERRVTKHHPMVIVLADASRPILSDILAIAKEYGVIVGDISSQMIQDGDEEKIQIVFRLSGENNALVDLDTTGFCNELKAKTNAIDIKVINHH